MAADVAGDLAAAGRVPDQHHVGQIERLHDRGQVVRVGVQVVAVPRLARPATAAAIVRDAAEAVVRDEHAAGRPTHRRSAASHG